jgi:hypothetical protein
MTDKQATIAEIETACDEMMTSVDGVPPDRMAETFLDQWSAKDLLAHTAAWAEFTVNDFQRLARGHMPCLVAFKEAEVDDWNAFLMRPRKLFPLEQVTFEFSHWHNALLDLLRSLPDPMFGPGVLANVCVILHSHLREHAGNIRQWRQREGI